MSFFSVQNNSLAPDKVVAYFFCLDSASCCCSINLMEKEMKARKFVKQILVAFLCNSH